MPATMGKKEKENKSIGTQFVGNLRLLAQLKWNTFPFPTRGCIST
jgi:hypothetical protein